MRRLSATLALTILTGTILVLAGCATAPRITPSELTVEDALAVVRRYRPPIEDFSGRARITGTMGDTSQSATVEIRYIRPDRFRLTVYGFAGTVAARIAALGDSSVCYVPSENYYVVADDYHTLIAAFLPEIDPELADIPAFFSDGQAPGTATSDASRIERRDGAAVLTLDQGGLTRQYLLEGYPPSPIEESVSRDGTVLWLKTVPEYQDCDGVPFPREMTVERPGAKLAASFSTCQVNAGLLPEDLAITIPSSAQRFVLDRTR